MSNHLNFSSFIGIKFSLFLRDKEIVRDFVITKMDTGKKSLLYDIYIYSFEAIGSIIDFEYFNFMINRPQRVFKCILKIGGNNIPIYIDSLTVNSYLNALYVNKEDRKGIFYGHIDDKDIEQVLNKKEESIKNRFEILDI